MNSSTSTRTLEIHGSQFNDTEATGKIVMSAACIGLGIFLRPIRLKVGATVTLLAVGVFSLYSLTIGSSSGGPNDGSRDAWYFTIAIFSFIIAPYCPSCCEHAYLDFAERKIITVMNYAWHETSRNCRPLIEFSHIVVRHLCHPGVEGPDTFTGSVGLKPLDGGPIVWVKDFNTNQDEVPQAAEEFARRLQKLTGLPLSGL